MKASEWETIKRLFDVAIGVPRDERRQWLDNACAGRPDLRETLEDLLKSYDHSSFDAIGEIEALPVFEPGKLIANRFFVVRLIARGGMGEVYEVRDNAMKGLRMALKTIRMDVAESKHAYEWFMREVWVGREVANDNICHVFDFVEHVERRPDGSERVVPCLTMQLLEGRTLEQEIAEYGPFAPQDCLEWTRQVVRALEATHQKGFAHRDVKPSNIMLVDVPGESRRRAVVMDFGLAKSRRQRTIHWETDDRRAGAPYFIAPEVLRGQEGGTPVDIYALGLVIDQMVTHAPAFSSSCVEELLWKKLHAEPEAPSARCESLPENWERTILWCIQRDPDKRPNIGQVISWLDDESAKSVPKIKRLVEKRTRRWFAAAAGVSVAAALGTIIPPFLEPLSGAVLVFPFLNQTSNDSLDYLCVGTVEELLRRLLSVEGLHVYAVRGDPEPRPPAEPNHFALEGYLQDVQGRPRLAVRLANYQTGELIWSGQFERELADPLRLEDEIAKGVLEAITRALSGPIGWTGPPLDPSRPATADSGAFEDYLRGCELWRRGTVPDALEAIKHLERAIQRDPGFALAHSALADVQHVLLTHNYDDTKSLLGKASLYAARAVEVDPSLPEVHLSLAAVLQMLWDWKRSEEEYKTAIQLQDRLARAHLWYAGLVLQFGEFDEALTISQKAIKLDPFDYPSHAGHGFCLWQAGRLRDAATHLEDLLSKCDLLYAHIVLGRVYAALAASSSEPESTGFFVKSLGKAALVSTRETEDQAEGVKAGFLKWSDIVHAEAHAARGDNGSARYYIDRLEQGLSLGKVSASAVAWAHAAAGDTERTLELLEAGAANQEREMLYLKVHPAFRSLRDHPRFKALLRQMKLGGDGVRNA